MFRCKTVKMFLFAPLFPAEGGLIKEGQGYLRLGSSSPSGYLGGTTVRQG